MTEHHTSTISDQEKAQILQERLKMGFNMVPFNQAIGLKITEMGAEAIRAEFAMQPQLIVNVFKQILHGGVCHCFRYSRRRNGHEWCLYCA